MLTIAVATKDRSDFLTRFLDYYASTNYSHWICIGDSSDSFHIEKTEKAIRRVENKLKVIYHKYPGFNHCACIKKLIELTSTPYLVLGTDDDFLVPEALEQCVQFLDGNSEYSAAHGAGALFTLKTDGPYGRLDKVGKYRQPILIEDTASNRLLSHLAEYSVTLFSVHHTDTWKAMYKDVLSVGDRAFSGELLPCCLSVIYGKVKQLDSFYLARQSHNRRYSLPDIYDWISAPDWNSSYQVFCNCLAEGLVRVDRIDLKEAKEIVKQAFWAYLGQVITGQFQDRYEKDVFGRKSIKTTLKRIPGMKEIILPMRSWMESFNPDISLPSLLNSSHRYHKDFMPIYGLLTKKD